MENVQNLMKKLVVTALFFLPTSAIFGQTDSTYTDCNVMKNGVYYADYDKETNIYIRFHDGDSVVTTSSIKDVKTASKFVNKDMGEGMLYGKYFTSNTNCSIRIKAKNDDGKVKMDGLISGDKLVLSIVNVEDNTAREFIFRFYPTTN